jgi:hypothetical protein
MSEWGIIAVVGIVCITLWNVIKLLFDYLQKRKAPAGEVLHALAALILAVRNTVDAYRPPSIFGAPSDPHDKQNSRPTS